MFLSASPVPQTGVLASVTQPSNSVIHGFTPVGRANHYRPSLKVGSILNVDRFNGARCSSIYKITDHPFLIRFISLTIIVSSRVLLRSISSQDQTVRQSPSDCEHKLRTSGCGWKNLFCPGFLTSPKKQLESLSVSSLIHAYEEDEDDNQDQ
ncbi:hypothetical protein F2Q68_00035624 [Brassica cretica]|uniref:Uncharacterized protein n=1 Tax=Brassica cretica TaxID=69181 RepID=A0A8S9HB70_BRACR|nr:hypothetical protein F2Q68_00035624 [Brassica cretica]